ncbi:chaperone protein DnaJ 72 [Tanacetum coccineum]
MDYYKILGLNTNATKEEIKEAFRAIAKKFHPDKHSSSPKSVKDTATLRFKQASEAYEVLVDDRKRAHYNSTFNHRNSNNGGYGNYGYTYDNRKKSSSSGGYDYYYGRKRPSVSRFEIAMGYINSRAFLLNVAFAGYSFQLY